MGNHKADTARELPVVGRATSFRKRFDRLTKRREVRVSWGGSTSRTHPDEDRALLCLIDDEGREMRLSMTPAELTELRKTLATLESWMLSG